MDDQSSIPQVAGCDCGKPASARPLVRSEQRFPLLLGVVLAILPKCPFCVVGYSSVMVLCSGARIGEYQPGAWSALPLVVWSVVAGTLVWNYRGRRTAWALALTLAAGALLTYAQWFTGDERAYYAGTALIFAAVLLNAGLHKFINL